MSSLSNRLIKLRKERNLKQNEAAELMGISKSNLSRYENGHRYPNMKMLKILSDFYHVSPSYLQYGEEKKPYDFLNNITEEEAELLREYLKEIRDKR